MPSLNEFDQKIVDFRMFLANWAIASTAKHFDFSSTRVSADETKLSAQKEKGKLKKHDDRVKWLRKQSKNFEKDPASFRNETEKKAYMYTHAAAAMKKETGNCLEQALSGLVILDKGIEELKNAISVEIKKTQSKINRLNNSRGMRLRNDVTVKSLEVHKNHLETIKENLNFKISLYHISGGDHVFIMLGNYPHDPNAVLCDIWAKEAYLASGAPSRLYDFDGKAKIGKRLKPYDPKRQRIIPKRIVNGKSSIDSIQTFTLWPTNQALPVALVDSKKIDCISVYRRAISLGITLHPDHIDVMIKDVKQLRALDDLLEAFSLFLLYQPKKQVENTRKTLLDHFANRIKSLLETPCGKTPTNIYEQLFSLKEKDVDLDDWDDDDNSDVELSDDDMEEELGEFIQAMLQSKVTMDCFSEGSPDDAFSTIVLRATPLDTYQFLCEKAEICDLCIRSDPSGFKKWREFDFSYYQDEKARQEKHPLVAIINEKTKEVILFTRGENRWKVIKQLELDSAEFKAIKKIWSERKSNQDVVKVYARTPEVKNFITSCDGSIKEKSIRLWSQKIYITQRILIIPMDYSFTTQR
jgi:hypothetical protein